MSEKKVVGRSIVIGLGIICVVLLVALVGAVANYTSIINKKDATYNDYVSTHSHTDSEYNASQFNYNNYVANHHHTDSEYDDYASTHSHTNSEYDSLQNQVNSLKAAQLSEVNLKWDFNEPWIGGHYVHVYGAIFNTGTNIAYNVNINVLLYDSSGAVIKSYTIMLGNINGKTYTNLDTNIDYSGHCATYSYQTVHS